MEEIWKVYFINREESVYEISNLGRCRNTTRLHRSNQGILTPKKNKSNGYCQYGLSHNGRQVYRYAHRMVCETFIPNSESESLDVNHKDGNKHNNVLSNLEWCTRKENMKHAMSEGLIELQPCRVYTLKGELVGEYSCVAEAINSLCPHLKYNKLGAQGVINNPQRQKYDYQWRTDFSVPVYDIAKTCHTVNKKICQLSLEDEPIATYNSMSECLESIGKKNGSRIKRCCDGLQDTYLGYKWAWL